MAISQRARSVPDLVRQIRKERSLTQEGLAHLLGVTFSTVNGWENGRHSPIPIALKALLSLATECGLDPELVPATRLAPGLGKQASKGDGK